MICASLWNFIIAENKMIVLVFLLHPGILVQEKHILIVIKRIVKPTVSTNFDIAMPGVL
jgi:hypothetical protein